MSGSRWNRGDGLSLAAIALGGMVGVAWSGGGASHDPPPPAAEVPAAEGEEGAPTETTPAAGAQALQDGGLAFYASSLGDGWAVTGDYAGRIHMDREGIRLDLPTGLLRFESAAQVDRRVVGVRLALAAPTSGGWRIVKSGEMHPLSADILPGGEFWTGPMSLSLPAAMSELEPDRWLVIVHELVADRAEGPKRATTYVHTDPGVLHRLLGWLEDGC